MKAMYLVKNVTEQGLNGLNTCMPKNVYTKECTSMYIQKNLGPGKRLLHEHMVMGTATGF
jgi:hypothetical protein